MHGAIEWQVFDAAERELIRKKLIRYMKDNGIGVPCLAERIKAAHPREATVPLSTLQRFLANRVQRTNEPCVALCHRFAQSLTASDCIAMLGERLSIFYGAGNGHDYSGNYLSGTGALEDHFVDKIEIVADAGFWRITERTAPYLGHAIYDGVLVSAGGAAVVVLKDRLAGRARNYMLWPQHEYLQGHGVSQSVGFSSSDTNKTLDLGSISILLRKK